MTDGPKLISPTFIESREQKLTIILTYISYEKRDLALAINCNDPFWDCNVSPSRGVGETNEQESEHGILLLTSMINCKGTLLNGTLEDESVKSSICKATA